VVVRRSVYDVVGGFNEDDVAEDYDMWLRVCRTFHVQHVPGALVNFRWHDRNTTTRIQGEVDDRPRPPAYSVSWATRRTPTA
jgi:hypothetical protein